jgi:hypothetical protein
MFQHIYIHHGVGFTHRTAFRLAQRKDTQGIIILLFREVEFDQFGNCVICVLLEKKPRVNNFLLAFLSCNVE